MKPRELRGHGRALDAQIVCQLLAVEGNVKFQQSPAGATRTRDRTGVFPACGRLLMWVILSFSCKFFLARTDTRFRMSSACCGQVSEQTVRIRWMLRNKTFAGAFATMLTFSTAPGVAAKGSANVPGGWIFPMMFRSPHKSSCMARAEPERSSPIACVGLPARRMYSPAPTSRTAAPTQCRTDRISRRHCGEQGRFLQQR